MKRWWSGPLVLAIFVSISAVAAQAPEVEITGRQVSVNADDVTLGRLIQLWDQAAGTHSTVPPDLENSKLSVHFSKLDLSDAVRKIFESQPFGYIFAEGQGIIVTSNSETAGLTTPPESTVVGESEAVEQSVKQPEPVLIPPQSPPVMWTPFGPILKPAPNAFVQLPPVLGAPPTPPFFYPQTILTPPSGAPNGPAYNQLFGAISIRP